MQAHEQLSEQVPATQLGSIPKQNVNAAPSPPQRRRTWQTEADVGLRRMIVEKILHIFQQRKPRLSQEWQQKLPDFVKCLEESLYRDALSKDEYSDLSTLEQRLQAVSKRIRPIRNNPNFSARVMNPSSSSMIPTPGTSFVSGGSTMIQSPGRDITMIPTPGAYAVHTSGASMSSSNIGNVTGLLCSTTGGSIVAMHDKISSARSVHDGQVASNVIIMSDSADAGPNVDDPSMNHSQQQQSLSFALSGHLFQNTNEKLGVTCKGYVNNSLLHENGAQQIQKPNGNVGHSNASFYMKPGNMMNVYSHQQHMPVQYDGFPTDHSGASPFHNTTTTAGPSRMIPVPGLPPQQSSMLSQTHSSLAKNHISDSKMIQGPEDRKPVGFTLQNDGTQMNSNSILVSDSTHQLQRSLKSGVQQQGCLSKEQVTEQSINFAQDLRHEASKSEKQQEQYELATQKDGHPSLQMPPQQPTEIVDSTVVNNNNLERNVNASGDSSAIINTDNETHSPYMKQQRWLLFLRHGSRCSAPEGQCRATSHCHIAKQLWSHVIKCTVRDCQFARCNASRILIRHHQSCKDTQCPVCVPVRHTLRAISGQNSQIQSASFGNANMGLVHGQIQANKLQTSPVRPIEPPTKRAKVEFPEQSSSNSSLLPHAELARPVEAKEKNSGVGKLNPTVLKQGDPNAMCIEEKGAERVCKSDSLDLAPTSTSMQTKQDVKEGIVNKTFSIGFDHEKNPKCSKTKNKGVSMIELFTPEQIKEHITSLRQWVGQCKAKAEKNQAMEHEMNENSCQLCAVETLTFEPPPIYCTPCGARIKRNAFYWTVQCGENRHYCCMPCYSDSRSENMEVEGHTYPKSKLEKRRNDEQIDEPWVQCDRCEKWQHQICALFNMRRNEGGQAEYTCPHCLLEEMRKAERKPLPQSSVLGAKDLPKTFLSDHIEQRLARRLKSERHERARAQGKSYDEVPGAESLVVRMVSSVDKKLEVKPRFLEIFQGEDYPTEFPYKSKVLLLFQRIEGVEVCLFGMYVQEFGAESSQPNQRRVYLSYLDSVKYFRPDVKTVNGEALRTFVYHEILIAYLDYCKARGFTSCYIWACPPLKGEDYILYCHPEIQKTPKSDKLREWYLTMLSKAAAEGVVVEVTNMYDYFFICMGESRAKVTAARLPYFDGDYWPGAAEDMIMQLQEEGNGVRQQKKGKSKTAVKKTAKTTAPAEMGRNASKDLQLMQKLGESIYPMKEDFILVHMQYACTHCCNFILSGHRWSCEQCKMFNLCDGCYMLEQQRDEWDKHPMNSKEAHELYNIGLMQPVPDTKDKDEIMESEFFDTRQAFLSLCQGNHYQYDTLRRAKNSSMMVLYHLHNPTAPAYVITCNICHCDIETGQGWRCETCPDFDMCNSCYSNKEYDKHPHKLVAHTTAAERDAQSKEARQKRVLQLRKMLYLLVHASQCGSPQCQYPNCRRVKGLFRHGFMCKTRASGGCHLCKKMWYLLQLHARACKEPDCRVPRCKDLKEHQRRAQQQMESRRRAAVMEMMRQRAAEATEGGS